MDEKILRYKTVWSNYDEAVKQIQNLVSSENLDMSKGFEQNLRKVSLVLQDVGSRLDAIGEGGVLDEQTIKTISTQLKVLGKNVKNLVIDFGSIRLPKDLSEELKASEETISAIQEKMKTTAGQLASARMKLARNTETGDYQLSAKSKASLFRHNVMPGATKAGQVTVEGTTYTTYKSLMEAAENGSEELKKKASEVYDYITTLKAPSGESYLTVYTNEAKRLQEELDNLQKQLEAERAQSETANSTKKTTTEFKQVDDILKKVNEGTDEYIAAEAKTQVQTEDLNKQEKKSIDTLENKQKTLIGTAAKTVLYHNAVNMLKSMIRSAVKVVSELDKAFTDMAVVTTMSREETWKLLDSFQALAQETGKTTTEIANMATKFYQQGKSTTEVLKLTEAAAKAATIAGIDGSRSIDLLTNALNGFQLSANQAMEVSDKFASLAASAATDYEELAIALSKVASQANLAGMSMDFTLGMLTKGLEVTREAPETIGTALKTVIARMRELSDYGKTLEDDTDINQVDKALKNVGVSLMDANGQFRDLDGVLTDLGKKWDTLNKNQQANVAVALAGTRQQSRLIAMMQDFDRTLELVDESANSHGATLAQQAKYMEGMAAKVTQLKNAYEGFIQSLTNNKLIIGGVELLTKAVQAAEKLNGILVPMAIALLGYGAVQLVQRNKIKQAEFEIEKLQLQKNIQEQESNLNTEKEAALKQEIAAATEANNKVDGAQQALIAAEKEKQLHIQEKINMEAMKKHRIDIGESTADIDAQLANKEKELAYDDRKINNIKKQIEVQKKQQKIANQNLKIKTQEFNQSNKEKILELDKLKYQMQGYTFSIRNIAAIIKSIAARIAHAKAIKKENDGLDDQAKKLDNTTGKLNKNTITTWLKSLKGGSSSLGAIAKKGVAIAIAAASIVLLIKGIQKFVKMYNMVTNPIGDVTEKLEKLQVELYNISKKKSNVSGLADEFEDLSNKIALTTEETERLQEIINSINDTAGVEVITATTTKEQLAQMKAYETSLELQQENLIDEQNQEIADGYQALSDANLAASGGQAGLMAGLGIAGLAVAGIIAGIFTGGAATAAAVAGIAAIAAGTTAGAIIGEAQDGEDLQKQYLKDFAASTAGKEALNSIARQEIEGIGEAASATQEQVLQMFRDQFANIFDPEKGVDVEKFEAMLPENFIENLDYVNSAEASMSEKWEYINGMINSSNKTVRELAGSLMSANTELAVLSKVSKNLAQYLDKNKISSQVIYDAWDKLSPLMTAAGKSNEEIAKVMSNIFDNAVNAAKSGGDFTQSLVNGVIEAIDSLNNLSITEEELNKKTEERDALLAQIKEKQKAIDEIEDETSSEYKTQNQELLDMNIAYNELNSQIDFWQNKSSLIAEGKYDALGLYDIQTMSDFGDALDTITGKVERLSKAYDLASMSGADLKQLFSDYPELMQKVGENGLTAADAIGSMRKEVEDLYKETNDAVVGAKNSLTSVVTSGQFSQSVIDKILANDEVFQGDYTDQQRADMLGISLDQLDEVRSLYDTYWQASAQQAVLNMYGANAEEYFRNVFGDIKAYSFIIEETDSKINKLKDDMSLMAEGSEEYIAAQEELISLYGDQITATQDQIAKKIEDATEYIGEKYKDTFIKTANGYEINMKEFNKLSEGQQSDVMALYKNQIFTINKELAELNSSLIAEAKAAADERIKILEDETNKINDELEARKTAYEDYFDKLDSLEEEEDTEQSRESLIKQINALTGGADAASKSKLKDLRQQLNDLNEEALETQRQAQRDAAIEQIDKSIEENTARIENITEKIYNVVRQQLLTGEETDWTAFFNSIEGYASGGTVDYTGLAMLHGTSSNPETVLSAQQTKMLEALIAALQLSQVSSLDKKYNVDGQSNNITIERLEIRPQNLNNSQDWKEAAGIFAETFNGIIRQGGLNVNVKK